MIRIVIRILSILIVLGLPFVALIRGAVYFHEKYDMGPYPSLLSAIILTAFILVIYLTVFYSRFTNKIGSLSGIKSRGVFAAILLIGFCVHGLFFISSRNMKDSEIAREIHDLHPISRIALSTLIFADKDLIITDTGRYPEDYRRMGLPSKRTSLHYRQKDGYAYAFDLRTQNRSDVRNFLLRSYFRLMGFNTLRHGGTGDHLHVSLFCHDLPGSL